MIHRINTYNTQSRHGFESRTNFCHYGRAWSRLNAKSWSLFNGMSMPKIGNVFFSRIDGTS